jgi:hypothetical protein
VTQADADENGGGVAVGLLDATISTGATLELEMALGGWVDLTTEWTGFDLSSYHAGSASDGAALMNETAEVSISIGELSWNMPVSENGTLTLLMPAGEVDFDSTFTTIQHEELLQMDYIAGAKSSVGEGRSPVAMTYTRSINSDSSITMASGSVVNATSIDDDETDLMAQPTEDAYETIEFDLDMNYDGTELSDVFTLTGSVGVAPDSSLWSIEFFNGTDWVESYDVVLGVGNDSSDTSVETTGKVSVRIIIANQSEAWHLEDAHSIKVRMSTVTGASSEISIDVQVPQTYGFEISDQETEIGIGESDNRQFGFMLTNTGNGDDSFTVSLSDNIEGWEITPSSSVVTVAKDDSRSQAFTVFSPSTWDGSTKTVTVTVTSENGVDTESYEVELVQAMISLKWDDDAIQTASDTTADDENTQVRIPIENVGYRDATGSVIVYLTYQATGKEYNSTTISIPAQSTGIAVFDVGAMPNNKQRFDYRVEVVGEDANFTENGIEPGDFSIQFNIDEESDDGLLFTLAIVALIGAILYGGVQMVRKGGSSKRF